MLAWFRGTGWRGEGQLPPDRKFILVGAPHTSNWDFLVFVGVAASVGRRLSFMGKHSLFRWPLRNLMIGLGGVAVRRGTSADLVAQMAAEFERRDDFILVIAPEGTRSKSERWKTGFYQMAMAAGVPLVCAGPDYARKAGCFGPVIRPTGDYANDMAPAFAFFRTMHPKHPDRSSIPG
jgi:1-acyl-sn-glycerol-3-phosphate acyltransferase